MLEEGVAERGKGGGSKRGGIRGARGVESIYMKF